MDLVAGTIRDMLFARNKRGSAAAIKFWAVSPERLEALLLETSNSNLYYGGIASATEEGLTICGVPIVPIPFEHDPLFKTFYTMARLFGASVNFTFDPLGPRCDGAYFHSSGGGWCYRAAWPSRSRKSSMYEIADGGYLTPKEGAPSVTADDLAEA